MPRLCSVLISFFTAAFYALTGRKSASLYLQRLDSSLMLPCYLYKTLFIHSNKKNMNTTWKFHKSKNWALLHSSLKFQISSNTVFKPIIYVQVFIFRKSLKHSIQENFITSLIYLLENLSLIFYTYFRFSLLLL